jgi:hypothetical protein
VPQSTLCPQPSPIAPQNVALPTVHAALGAQLGPPTQSPSSHVQSPVQAPHFSSAPQPSPTSPQ